MSDKVIVSKTSILEPIEIYKVPVGNSPSGELAAEWTMDAIKEIYAQIKTVLDQATPVSGEPFGYYKAEPFGWTDCAKNDEGAVALYEAPQPAPDTVPVEKYNRAIEALKKYVPKNAFKDNNMWFFEGTVDGISYDIECSEHEQALEALAEAMKVE